MSRYCWSPPALGLPRWWRSRSSERLRWYKNSVDGSAQGVAPNADTLPTTQSRREECWAQRPYTHWSWCPSLNSYYSRLFCTVCRKLNLPWPICCLFPYRFWHLMRWYTPDRKTGVCGGGVCVWQIKIYNIKYEERERERESYLCVYMCA